MKSFSSRYYYLLIVLHYHFIIFRWKYLLVNAFERQQGFMNHSAARSYHITITLTGGE